VSLEFDRVILTDVSRYFGRRRALSQISFTCRTGDVMGLLGHNGAGKSTLLAIVATLLRPSSGEVRYGTVSSTEAPAALRGCLGLLGHEVQLYSELTARENLRFFAGLYGLVDDHRRVDAALDRAGLLDRGDDPVSSFSRGMRQRLALERTLMHEPRLLLLDEPFTGLDHAAAVALVDRVRRLASEGRIIVIATHDLDLAAQVVTRAVILRDGRLAAIHDGRDSLRDRYADAHAGHV
jgi:ABC-type multidrug transport system ATPase subunit